MDSRKKTRAMIESALITAIAVVFTMAGTYIPFLGILLMFLPAPFIIIGVKNSLKYCIISLVTAGILIGALTGLLNMIIFITTAGLSSIVIVYMIQKKYSFNLIFILGSIASLISTIIFFALLPKLIGFGFVELMENAFDQTREMYKTFFEMSGTDTENAKQILSNLDQSAEAILLIIPFGMIVSSVFTTYTNYIVSGAILRRIGLNIEKPKKFSYFRLPTNFMMGTLVIVILTYLTNKFNIVNSIALNANIMILFQVVFIMQGLAVLSFLIEKKGIRDAFRRIILVFVLLIQLFSLLLFVVGLFDVIFNIRKLES